MRTNVNRVLAATLAAAMALPVVDLRPVNAASAPVPTKVTKPADDLEFSSSHRRRHRHHRGDAAVALGAVTAMFGTIAALAAASRYRKRYYYDHYYGHHYGPYHYGAYGYPYRRYYYHW
jgi:hypothetical protein